MAFSEEQLKLFNDDFTALTGEPVQRFVCPITLRDEPGVELCDGHILNHGIQTAARKTVVQWGDIDHYYGQTIEPDLVAFLNTPVATPDHLMRKGKSLTVTFPSGEQFGAFITDKPGASAKFPRIDLVDAAGNKIASPFLRAEKIDPNFQKGLKVEWLMGFTDSALLGSILKSAYLALWSILGYRYVYTAAGDYLRQPLAQFFGDRATKTVAVNYFGKFKGAVNFFLSDVPEEHFNTISDGLLWFHCRKDGPEEQRLFALSCLFRVNNRMIDVMVPYCTYPKDFEGAREYYEALLKDRSTPQDVHFGYRQGERLECHPDPLDVQFRP